jgi:hypothetical protein
MKRLWRRGKQVCIFQKQLVAVWKTARVRALETNVETVNMNQKTVMGTE